eukprot:4248051-Heterocapsa_arctica.AAC.1
MTRSSAGAPPSIGARRRGPGIPGSRVRPAPRGRMPRGAGPPALQRPQGRRGGSRRRPAGGRVDHPYAHAPGIG